MVEWWQALALSVAAGLIALVTGLVSGYFSHHLTTSAGSRAEERQAKRRVEEEQRQATRQLRRERIQPVLDFLDAAKSFRARGAVEKQIEMTLENKPQDEITDKVREALTDKSVGDDPDIFRLVRELFLASASAPTVAIRQGVVFRVFIATITPREQASETLDDAVSAAEEIVEKYVTVV